MKFVITVIAILLASFSSVNVAQATAKAGYESEAKYIVSIYYAKSRKYNAKSLKRTLERRGYRVNLSSYTFESKMPSSSYIHFQSVDEDKMEKVKKIMTSKLYEPFQVNYSEHKMLNQMSVVLVDK